MEAEVPKGWRNKPAKASGKPPQWFDARLRGRRKDEEEVLLAVVEGLPKDVFVTPKGRVDGKEGRGLEFGRTLLKGGSRLEEFLKYCVKQRGRQ